MVNLIVESKMTYKNQFEYCQLIGRHIRPRTSCLWFLGIFLPIASVLSAFIAWHNNLVTDPTAIHILMRGFIAFAAFGVGMIVFFFKVISPAIAAAAQETEKKDGDGT